MIDIATHVRIFDQDPADDLVTKRAAAVKDLGARLVKGARRVDAVLKSANELALAIDSTAKLPEALGGETVAAIKKTAIAFVAEGQELQIVVCSLLGALQGLDSATPGDGNLRVSDLLAIGLWSSLSFQLPRTEPKLEALRAQLLGKAREVVHLSAHRARRRTQVRNFAFAAPNPVDAAKLKEAFDEATSATIDALRSNAALDREEIDLLWWALGDWSTMLNRQFSAASSTGCAIASGIEVGRMLRRLPTDAFRHLALRNVKQVQTLTLVELLAELGDDRGLLIAPYLNDPSVLNAGAVFPLLSAMVHGKAEGAAASIKRPLSEWTERALLEASVLQLASQLPKASL